MNVAAHEVAVAKLLCEMERMLTMRDNGFGL
jgi:hypothetical protein